MALGKRRHRFSNKLVDGAQLSAASCISVLRWHVVVLLGSSEFRLRYSINLELILNEKNSRDNVLFFFYQWSAGFSFLLRWALDVSHSVSQPWISIWKILIVSEVDLIFFISVYRNENYFEVFFSILFKKKKIKITTTRMKVFVIN